MTKVVDLPVQAASVKKRYGDRRDTMNQIAHAIDHIEPKGVHVPITRSAPSQQLPIQGPSPRKFGPIADGSPSGSDPSEVAITGAPMSVREDLIVEQPSIQKMGRRKVTESLSRAQALK